MGVCVCMCVGRKLPADWSAVSASDKIAARQQHRVGGSVLIMEIIDKYKDKHTDDDDEEDRWSKSG